jgi:hypothetical protein
LGALGHAIGIVIDFRARTKAKRPCQVQKIALIYQSLDCLATREPGRPGYTVNAERAAAAGSWRVRAGRGWRERVILRTIDRFASTTMLSSDQCGRNRM